MRSGRAVPRAAAAARYRFSAPLSEHVELRVERCGWPCDPRILPLQRHAHDLPAGTHAAAARAVQLTGEPTAVAVTIPLSDEEREREAALRAGFARFWSTATGEPRAIFDSFIS